MVPKLSFFKDQEIRNSNWVSVCFGDVVSKVSKKHKPSDGVMNCIQLEHISQETGELLGHTYTDKVQSISTLFTKNHILYSKLRPYLKKYWYAEFNGTCTGEIWVLKAEKINSRFLYFVIQTDQFTETANISSGSKMPRADWNLVAKYRFHAPSFKEQQKIASFLSSVDDKISQLEKKKTLLETYKRGIIQKIFSQELRFKDENGQEFSEWRKMSLGDLTYKVGKKNKDNLNLPIYSINNKEGFCPQSEQFEGLDSNDRGYDISMYKIVNEKTFAYNPARINVGSIGYNEDLNNIIISSLYVCFKAKSELIFDSFLLFYTKSKIFNTYILRFQEGGVRQYLFYENFSKIPFGIPSLQEQQKIASFLSSIDKKIEITSTQLEKTREFKKGLLQQMFV